MSRPKEGRETEFYLGQIRALKAENRSLKKQIRVLERREHLVEEHELGDIIEEIIIKKEVCVDCGKGFLQEKEVLGRYWHECDLCSFRTKVKKL